MTTTEVTAVLCAASGKAINARRAALAGAVVDRGDGVYRPVRLAMGTVTEAGQ